MVQGTFDDHAFGCIFGAFIGDSCGSANEFNMNIESEERMDEIMTMPGEGPWNLSPGQITDDSELALCLMQGIIKGN
jgi:ADP-ribosylglycohydrolase